MQLRITVRASRDLRELHLYGIDRYGGAATDAYLAEIFAKFQTIAQWPFAAQPRLAMQPPVRLSKCKAHNILYAVEHETVLILRVFHHSANWIDLL